MSRKQKKILVGTALIVLVGWIFAEAVHGTTAEFLIVVGIPAVIGSGWAFLAKD